LLSSAGAAASARMVTRPWPLSQHRSTKTELCSFFYRTGSCVYGDRCVWESAMPVPLAAMASRTSFPARSRRCKFRHQHEPVLLNQAGCPIRPTEPPCTHYLKRGW
jgi:hypothetical protein